LYWPTHDHTKSKRSAYWPERKNQRVSSRVLRKRSIPNSNLESSFFPKVIKRSASLVDHSKETHVKSLIKKESVISSHDANNIGSSTSKDDTNTKNRVDTDKKTKEKSTVDKNSHIKCLYKLNRVAVSVTPSYSDDKNAQSMVENYSYGL
jgi:hypothetical protein